MNNRQKIAVVGAGSWGTAIAVMLANKELNISLWSHEQRQIDNLLRDRENKEFLPTISLPDNIHPEADLKKVLDGVRYVIMVVPSHAFRSVFENVLPLLQDECRVVSAVKGIENDTLMTMTQVMAQILEQAGRSADIPVGVLSGPSFAVEVAKNIPTAVTVGFSQLEIAKEIQQLFVTKSFRVYASDDVIGLEISAALKNIIAIATGVCDGLGYGLNTRAALITRGLAEIQRLGIVLGAQAATFSGLSGMGDLLLTCTGSLSRNRTVGLKLGEGKKLDQIKSEMNMVAEGIKTTRSGYDLANKYNIDMPILEQVYEILYKDKDCSKAVVDLLQRELKTE